MKTIGIQINSNEIVLVVLTLGKDGKIDFGNESAKFKIENSEDQKQIKQFRDQMNTIFDLVDPDRIAILARNAKAKGRMAPSPVSFKLEGIIQLYDNKDIELVWPQTIAAFYKKNQRVISPKNKYQEDATSLAYFLLYN